MLTNTITTADLLLKLRNEGIKLWEEGGKLRYKAPQGVLKKEDIEELKQHKEAIISLLQAEQKQVTIVSNPEKKYTPFPLTDVQSAYLLGRNEVFNYGGVACHIYMELTYDDLDPLQTEKVWNQLIARHEMLRAVIDKEGYQQVLEEVPEFKVTYIDAKGKEETTCTAILEEIRTEMGHRVYETSQWPLFDIQVTRTNKVSVFHFSIEFLIADWASIWMLLSEFEKLYNYPKTVLPEIHLSFRDYLIGERGLRETTSYAKDKQYWMHRIQEIPGAPDLPMARNHVPSGKGHFTRRFVKLTTGEWNELKSHCQQLGVTPTTVVMTAYAAVIERWSKTKDFCLNLTVLNRLPLHEEVNAIVGDFTSVSLLQINWKSEETFLERIKKISNQLFDDLDHRLFSGVEVIREITRQRGRGEALMPYVFTSAIGLTNPEEGNQIKGKLSGHGISQTPQVFIDCQAMDTVEGLHVNWDIREGVFPEGVIDDMFHAFSEVLRKLVHDKNCWEARTVVALPEWQIIERNAINATEKDIADKTLHHQLVESIKNTPEAIAVIDNGQKISYGEIGKRATALANKLLELGCKPQDRIAISLEKGMEQIISAVAILSVGGVYVPIDVFQPVERRNHMLHHAEIRFAILHEENLTTWKDVENTIPLIPVETVESSSVINLQVTNNTSLPAYIIYTSGSTGLPKGVVISHKAAVNTITDINNRFGVTSSDTVLSLAQLGFDLSVYDIFGLLSVGGTLVIPSKERQTDPSHWATLIQEYEVTVWNTVPAIMQMLVTYLEAEKDTVLSTLRLALLSGDWIPLTLPDSMKNIIPDIEVISLGGATEAAIWSIHHVYQGIEEDWSSIPYGKPLANQGFRVLDGHLSDCPVWSTGDLYITGVGLADEYLNDKELTENAFFFHPVDGQRLYKTGDLGRYTPGGEIEFLGREDHQVKIRGHRIELGEIEAALVKHHNVKEAGVVVAGRRENQSLFAVVVIQTEKENQEKELIQYVRTQIPEYMVPAHIQVVEVLPVTKNGKINKKEITRWASDFHTNASLTHDDDSMNELESSLAIQWKDTLGISAIGKRQSFYDLGADSLVMAQMAGKLRDQLRDDVTYNEIPYDALLRQMLNFPTIESLALFIEEKGAGKIDKSSTGEQDITAGSNGVLTYYGDSTNGPLRVIFHAGIGTMNCFLPMLEQLKKEDYGPIVGVTVKDTDLYCEHDPYQLIESVAEDYANRLIETGHKEMQLIGYCMGGQFAIEVARRLLEQEIEVVDMVLIDSHPVYVDVKDDLVIESLFVPNLNISMVQAGFREVNPMDVARGFIQIIEENKGVIPDGAARQLHGDEGLVSVSELFTELENCTMRERFTSYVDTIASITGENMEVEMAEGLFKVYRQSYLASTFTPLPYMGDIRFLNAAGNSGFLPGTDEKTIAYWREACLGEMTVEEIGGDHFSCIEPPHLDDLVPKISAPFLNQ